MSILDAHHQELQLLASQHRLRRLIPRRGSDFASNDYLGLAGDPLLGAAVAEALARGVPVGSAGSRLLRGNHEEHEQLEEEAARFFGCQAALFFASGYAANSALLATLPAAGDLIVHDSLVHASAREGMRLGRAVHREARHNDVGSFERAIDGWRLEGGRGRVWLAVESLYSMDGDIAPLDQLAQLADRHDAFLLIDEAHATGVFGQGGRGLAAGLEGRDNVVTLRTCGKALGCEGALVCGPAAIKEYLINRARGFVFSTAPSPLIAAAVRGALRLIENEPERRSRLHRLTALAHERLVPLGATSTGTQILPLVLGDDARTMAVAASLQQAGCDVRGIRPPTVPPGTARLRLSITLNVTDEAIERLASALAAALR